ncbi:MAG TPA: oxygenase MpaB family protein [Solirubrobacteraceae bacterium]|nr:oxygenase MpaB family protein [Solirubrobacteraceae bacterium]
MAVDVGYFPRGSSMLRTVQEEHLVGLMFGQRALCIGACAPLNYVGTSEHSHAKLTPFRRLAHTGKAFETIFFGTRAEADRVLSSVYRLHEGVVGELSEPAGPLAAGTPYSALDPALMLWTVAVMVDSAQRIYELLIRRLSDGEREALWQDYLRFGELFGLPGATCPRNYPEFRTYWREQLASPELHLTEEARYIGYATAFEIPFPRFQSPGKRAHDAVMCGSLPTQVRELYGLRFGRREQLEFAAAVQTMRTARRLTPPPLRRGYNTRHFDGVAATERRRIERGQPTPQITEGGPVGVRLPVAG